MSRAAKRLRRPNDPQLTRPDAGSGPDATRALVLRPRWAAGERSDRTPAGQLEEAIGLARAIDLEVVDALALPLRKARPASLFGRGQVAAVGERVAADGIALVVVDAPLSPVQQRNLERAWACKVIDRTGLILEIFGERAQTSEGRLQVELAALTYQRSRLVRSWTHLERQRGGFGFLGGPGEAQIELDRRRIDDRITNIQRDLDAVKRTRGLHRAARQREDYPVIALVGYTNAGKSTLFNRLTGAAVGARDQLFATLDPTMRRLALPSGRQAILSDTVGFIADLPTDLVAAFRATLEEVRTADLVIHVRDIAHAEAAAQRSDVLQVLASLDLEHLADEGRLIEFWNKADLLTGEAREPIEGAAARQPDVVLGSARTGQGIEALRGELDRRLATAARVVELELDPADGARLAWLYRHGNVLTRSEANGRIRLRVALQPAQEGQLAQWFPTEATP
jgi:GTPase